MTPTLRPAQPTDKSAITALAAKIWEGEDYLHRNFDNWVAQERGRFIVAYEGDHLVGCNKLTEFRPGEWWKEQTPDHPRNRRRPPQHHLGNRLQSGNVGLPAANRVE